MAGPEMLCFGVRRSGPAQLEELSGGTHTHQSINNSRARARLIHPLNLLGVLCMTSYQALQDRRGSGRAQVLATRANSQSKELIIKSQNGLSPFAMAHKCGGAWQTMQPAYLNRAACSMVTGELARSRDRMVQACSRWSYPLRIQRVALP